MTVEEQQRQIVLPEVITTQAVMPPSFRLDIHEATYHADKTAVSQGALGRIVTNTPEHFFHDWTSPPVELDSDAARTGSLLHMALLEPERYGKGIVRPVFGDGRKKEVKEAKAEWAKGCPPGSLIIEQEDKELVEAMAIKVLAHPTAAALLKGAMCEATVYWVDRDTQILCRARIDAISVADILVDIKTVEDASEEAHRVKIARDLYHLQGAHYLEAANAVAKEQRYRDFVHIVVERNPPHGVAVYALSDRAIAKGQALRTTALRSLRDCLDTKKWPGYGDSVRPIDLPEWAYRQPQVSEDF